MKNKVSRFGTIVVLLGLLLTVFQNCGSSEEFRTSKSSADISETPDLNSRYKVLEDLAASDLSCSSDNDCVAVSTGHRPCGGPSGYLMASLLNPKLSAIQTLAAEFSEAERQFNIENQLMGTCDYLMAPSLSCQQSQCVKN
jgi:hypothetical protein